MDDKLKEVLEQYDMKIQNVYRVRGAYILDTDQGLRIIREFRGVPQKAQITQNVKKKIAEQGHPFVDLYVENKEGNIITENSMGTPYVLKQWFQGEDCDLKKKEHLVRAGRNLAQLHNYMRNIQEEPMDFQADTFAETLVKHNRELRRIRTYIREKKQRNEFELFFLSMFPEFYQQAEEAESMLKGMDVKQLYEEVEQNQTFCHGNYTYHNLVMLPDATATMDFEKTHMQLQVLDLYDFLRKLMEKSNWKAGLLKLVLESYETERPLSSAEKQILQIKLVYPEKFWKITNYYYNRKKSWISQKNIEKLQSLQQQKNARQNLLGKLQEVL